MSELATCAMVLTLRFCALVVVGMASAVAAQPASASTQPWLADPVVPTLPNLFRALKPSVVTVLVYSDGKPEPSSLGTGWFFAADRIITNRHVIRDASKAQVRLASGTTVPVLGVLASDAAHDLAMLKVDVKENAPMPIILADVQPSEGEQIFIIGSPLGLELSVSEGIISSVREVPSYGRILQTTAAISPGSSGSPVLNMRGQVVGVATFRMVGGESLNFAVTAEGVRSLKPTPLKTFAQSKADGIGGELDDEYMIGLQLFLDRKSEQALGHVRRAVDKNPQDADAWIVMGFCLDDLGRVKDAVTAYNRAAVLKPDDAKIHLNLGNAYGKLGQHEKAITSYGRAIRIDPAYVEAYRGIGSEYRETGRLKDAIVSYKQALRLKPSDHLAHRGLSLTYCQLGLDFSDAGRAQEAIEAYQQAVRVEPDFAFAHELLGRAYAAEGKRAEALAEYKVLQPLDAKAADELFSAIYK